MTTSALLLILNSTRAAEIPNILKGLGGEQQDHLMAYLYKVGGFNRPAAGRERAVYAADSLATCSSILFSRR